LFHWFHEKQLLITNRLGEMKKSNAGWKNKPPERGSAFDRFRLPVRNSPRRENSKMTNSNPNHCAKLAADRALRPASGTGKLSNPLSKLSHLLSHYCLTHYLTYYSHSLSYPIV